MKSFSDWREEVYKESPFDKPLSGEKEVGGGLPDSPGNYRGAARSITPGGFGGNLNIGAAYVNLIGNSLHIDTANYRFVLPLDGRQVQMILSEFE
jgi:hypothetical protein